MKIATTLAGTAVAAGLALSMTAVPAHAVDAGSGPKMQLDCTMRTNAPVCDINQDVTVNDKGYKPGSHHRIYRFHVEAIVPRGKVTAKVLSTGVTATRRIGSSTSNQSWLPVRMPKEGCPVVHLYHRGAHPRNFGVYPTCGAQVHFPAKHEEYFSLCKTNRTDHTMWLERWRHANLRETRRVAPGVTSCVISVGFGHHWRQFTAVTYTSNKTTEVNLHDFVLSGPIWNS